MMTNDMRYTPGGLFTTPLYFLCISVQPMITIYEEEDTDD